ncbi:MAG: 23S rRNA (adenine2503-C2)-methyltransferase, partial [Arcticibacterium sp.]
MEICIPMTEQRIDIRALDKIQLLAWFIKNGEKKFRANQVWEWLWQKSAISFEAMSNLSKPLRDTLNEHFV